MELSGEGWHVRGRSARFCVSRMSCLIICYSPRPIVKQKHSAAIFIPLSERKEKKEEKKRTHSDCLLDRSDGDGSSLSSDVLPSR